MTHDEAADELDLLQKLAAATMQNIERTLFALLRCECFRCTIERLWNKLFRGGAEPTRHKVELPEPPVFVPEDTVWH